MGQRGPRFMGAALGALAALLGLSSCGSSQGGGAAPVAFGDTKARAECITGTYLPNVKVGKVTEGPPPRDWSVLEHPHREVQADRGVADVTIRPRGQARDVTITGIDFGVERYVRNEGQALYRRCGRQLHGAAVETDLDSTPPRIVATEADLHGHLGAGAHVRSGDPIHFPWKVSLARPVHLFLVADARHCYCVWRATIHWRAGGAEGDYRVDDGGRDYRVVDTISAYWFSPTPRGTWQTGTKAWIGAG